MDKKTYSLIEDYMISCMKDSAHDKEHIYRVLYNALEIARAVTEAGSGQPEQSQEQGNQSREQSQEQRNQSREQSQEQRTREEEQTPDMPVNYDILIAACLLHDIGRGEQYKNPSVCHAKAGGEMAYRFLTERGFDETFAEQVKQCIWTHRFRKGNPPQSIEAKILFDADKLDVAGALGIARTLMYKGIVGEPLYTVTSDGSVSGGEEDLAPSFFQEYKYKLENIYANFYTEKGGGLARERQQAAVRFYEGLFDEVSRSYERGREELARVMGK